MVSVFLSISDYLDPPALRHLKPKSDASVEEEKKESLMRVMINNAFFVTHKGVKTNLCASVLGGFLLEMKTCCDGSRVILGKLGKKISCTVNGDPRLCFLPENLVDGTCINLSTDEFAKIERRNAEDSGRPLFTMSGGVFECGKLSVSVNINEEILKYLLSDMDSLGGIINDFMLPKPKEEEEEKPITNLLSFAEEGYIINEFKKVNRVRETKSMYCLNEQKPDKELKRGKFASTSDISSVAKEEDNDKLNAKKDAENEFVDNDITELQPSEDGPLIFKVNDIKLEVKIAVTKRVVSSVKIAASKKGATSVKDGAIVISLDISEAVFSSGHDTASKSDMTYIKFFARDFSVVDSIYYSNEDGGAVLKFDEKRLKKWRDAQLEKRARTDKDDPIFGIFSENKIAFYYRESGSKLKLRLSVHPIEIAFLWNEVDVINDYYSIYANASKAIAERRERFRDVDVSKEFEVLSFMDTRVEVESFHLWPIGIKLSFDEVITSGSNFDTPTGSDYTPLIPDLFRALIPSVSRAPWHFSPFVLKSDPERTVYKDDISVLLFANYKNDYSIGRFLRAFMHIGFMASFLKLGKAAWSIASVSKGEEVSFIESFQNLGATIFEVGGDTTKTLFVLTRELGDKLTDGAFPLSMTHEYKPKGLGDGTKKFFSAVANGILSGIDGITLKPVRVYKEHGFWKAAQYFLWGIPCTIIRPVEGTVYGLSLLFYGASESIAPGKLK